MYQLLRLLLVSTLPFAPPALAQPSQLEPTTTQVSAGGNHTCALATGGGVKCWGYNASGQLGDDSTTDRLTQVDVGGLTSGVTAISAGQSHTCALTTAGGVKCWGRNIYGQLGDGSTINRLTPVDVGGLTSGVTAIAAGSYHTCALTTAGGVKCWGYNAIGQLGDGGTLSRLTPVVVSGLASGVTAIAMAANHTCALTTGGGVKCWGSNYYGGLGDGSTTNRLTPVEVSGLASGVTAISAGQSHTCALTAAGGMKCWGRNELGELGDGTAIDRWTPFNVSNLTSGVTAIAAAGDHTCALTTAGGVKCWGYNPNGQLGDGSAGNLRRTPVDVSGLASGVIAVTAGGNHTCALTTAGGVRCWGYNLYGQLGLGSTSYRFTPAEVNGRPSGVAVIVAGEHHTCALTTAGGVKCWGRNGNGQLGDGSTTGRLTPVDVSNLTSGVTAISAGGKHTCALTTAGGVKCWGYNIVGQLGDASTAQRLTPVDVSGLATGVRSITAGGDHTCALTTAGGVKCWGYNSDGQLGDGSTAYRLTPVAVSGLTSGVIAITAGDIHTCALTTAGGVKCWGFIINSLTPIDVSGLASGVTAIAAGSNHTCALTSAGGVKCWGSNSNGQLGDGSTSYRSAPGDVSGLTSGVTAIGPGRFHTCAVTSGGGVKCWGANQNGRLGDGSTVDSLTPVDVNGLPSGVTAITAGGDHTCALTTAGGIKCWGYNNDGQLGNGIFATQLTPINVLRGQSISFAPPVRLVLGAAAGTLSASATSALPVSFDTWTPTTCTVSGNTVTALAPALCGIRASQTGNANNASAPQKLVLVNVVAGYSVAATASPAAAGTVNCTPNPVSHGSNSTCTSTANAGYNFSAFSGDCAGATCVLTNVTSDKNVTANFTLNSYAISTTANPVAGGSVTCTPNPVNHGSNSTCTSTTNAPYLFASWSGDCTGATCLLANVTGPRSVTASFVPTLNVDGSAAATRYHPLVDGLIVVRFMQGRTGTALTAGTSVASATITDPAAMVTYLTTMGTLLDIDGNGTIDPATDGLLIMRYLLGLRGDALIANALGAAPRARSTATEIEAWLTALMP